MRRTTAEQRFPGDATAEQMEAVANIADEMAGRAPAHDFKSELVCIVDTVDKGILVYRNEKRSVILPQMRAAHWAKRYFEGHYLRAYRR